jgi:hypothetical protein
MIYKLGSTNSHGRRVTGRGNAAPLPVQNFGSKVRIWSLSRISVFTCLYRDVYSDVLRKFMTGASAGLDGSKCQLKNSKHQLG